MPATTDTQPTLGERFAAVLQNQHSSPRPSFALVPPAWIASAMEEALYMRLNLVPAFRRGLAVLFENWAEQRAKLFARAWALPARGLSDLRWSRDMWRLIGGKRAVLRVGHRLYAAPEHDTEDEMVAVGYRRFPPRLLNSEDLAVGAERLYRRATLRWSWRRIAAAQDPDADDLSGLIKAVHAAVHRWANAIGVHLPHRPPGRPRRKRAPKV